MFRTGATLIILSTVVYATVKVSIGVTCKLVARKQVRDTLNASVG